MMPRCLTMVLDSLDQRERLARDMIDSFTRLAENVGWRETEPVRARNRRCRLNLPRLVRRPQSVLICTTIGTPSTDPTSSSPATSLCARSSNTSTTSSICPALTRYCTSPLRGTPTAAWRPRTCSSQRSTASPLEGRRCAEHRTCNSGEPTTGAHLKPDSGQRGSGPQPPGPQVAPRTQNRRPERPRRHCHSSSSKPDPGAVTVEISLSSAVRTHALCMHTQERLGGRHRRAGRRGTAVHRPRLATHALHTHAYAGLIRPREIHPRNPHLRRVPKRETAGRGVVPT